MNIITWNVNGYKSAYERGDFREIYMYEPDVICLQEVKISNEEYITETLPKGYKLHLNNSDRKGYSGVAIICKLPVNKIIKSIGFERFDNEGRILKAKIGEYTIYNFYMPHGGRQKENMPYKLEVIRYIISMIKSEISLDNTLKVIIATDFNIAHEMIDLARPSQNKNNTMFTKEERNLIDELLENGMIDSYRTKNRDRIEYTWWPYSFNAKERNMGWRIDYLFITQNLVNSIKKVRILKDFCASDHCPVQIIL